MIRVALAQINPTVGDLVGNRNKIADYISRAKDVAADVVVFPELAVCGYPPEDLLYKGRFVKDQLKVLRELAAATRAITAVIGFVDIDKNKNLYNAAAVIQNGALKGVIHKHDLPNYGVFDEKRYFSSGQKEILFSLQGHLVGINICEDIWKDDGLSVRQAKSGARVLINISSSPYHAGKITLRTKMLQARAKQTNSFICYTNLVGGQDELVFDGASMIVSPQGKILARARQFAEELLVADLDLPSPKIKKGMKPSKMIALDSSREKILITKNEVKPTTHFLLDPIEEIYQALVLGTRDYVLKNGFKKIVLGLSGGIDSALVAAIACDALGKENVIGITMPSKFSSSPTQLDAKVLAENLGMRFIQIPIEGILCGYLSALQNDFSGQNPDTTEENLQARIRGNLLMAFSNKFGWLVLTTGNKSEIAVGYCTLYGDMSGGFAVIKDVPKTTIYQLARFRNAREKTPAIPQSTIDRAPTAELRENQKDEDSLPPYDVLDPILKGYVEKHHSFEQVLKQDVVSPKGISSTDVVNYVKDAIRLVDRSEYKRRQSPPGVKITPRAFGKDWRLPITNRYKEF